jgi:sugar phosphate isomerase/epimerase
MQQRLAVPTRCLSNALKPALREASRLQVAGVQLDVRQEVAPTEMGPTAIRHFRKTLEELNLKVASGAFPLRQAIYDAQWLERRLDAIRQAMTFCFQLGTDVLTVRPGRLPDPDTRHDEWKVLTEILNELTRFGNHSGVTLCLSLSFESPERVRRLLQEVQEGPLGINFDPLNLIGSGQDPSSMFRDFHADIKHIRARDGLRNIDDEVEETPLGLGAVDWTELVALLHEADYRGWIVLDRTAGENRARDLEAGLTYFRQLMPFRQ